MCKQSVHHVSTTKYLWSIVIIGRQRLVKSFLGTISVFGVSMDLVQNLQKNVHGPDPWQGAHGHGPWKWSMDPVQRGGPWTRGPCFVLTRQLLPSARCQRAKHLLKKPLNSIFFTSRKSNFSVQNNVVSVCCSYLNMVFPGIGNVKYPHGRIDQQQQMSKGQILRYIS